MALKLLQTLKIFIGALETKIDMDRMQSDALLCALSHDIFGFTKFEAVAWVFGVKVTQGFWVPMCSSLYVYMETYNLPRSCPQMGYFRFVSFWARFVLGVSLGSHERVLALLTQKRSNSAQKWRRYDHSPLYGDALCNMEIYETEHRHWMCCIWRSLCIIYVIIPCINLFYLWNIFVSYRKKIGKICSIFLNLSKWFTWVLRPSMVWLSKFLAIWHLWKCASNANFYNFIVGPPMAKIRIWKRRGPQQLSNKSPIYAYGP